MKHRNCPGHFEHWVIPEHHFSFQKCDHCGHVVGGDKTKREIERLMRTKVTPTMRRA